MAKTRNYKHSKLNAKGATSGAPALVNAIKRICTPLTKEGETVPVDVVVAEINKAKVLRITHPEMLRALVSCAVRDGSVPGFDAKRGPKGGVFHVPSYIKAYGKEDYEALRGSSERAALKA